MKSSNGVLLRQGLARSSKAMKPSLKHKLRSYGVRCAEDSTVTRNVC
jgi:hypothetical protein